VNLSSSALWSVHRSCIFVPLVRRVLWSSIMAMQFDEVEQGNAINSDMEGLSDINVRAGFIRKVYGLLTVQLVLTVVIAYPIQSLGPVWVQMNYHLCQIAMFTSLGLVLGVSCCCEQLARKVPYNYAFLFLVTACESVLVGFISAMYTTESVMLAVALTAGIFFCLTAYAFTTKTDFTGMGPYMYAALCGLMLTSFVCMFFPSPMMQKVIGGAGAIIFSMYIVYDTQLICGGKHKKHQFGVDDYVFAALNIYLDIINLFIYLLSIFGDRR